MERYPKDWIGQRKRREERARLYRKLQRYRAEILHLCSNQLIETAVTWRCQTIALEDLRTYELPKHKRTLSHKLANWFRGTLYEVLTYKATRAGIRVVRVTPWGTSTYCHRCGGWGLNIRDPGGKNGDKTGRFFHCPQCQFTTDRDYIGALNMYQMEQTQRKKRYSLKCAKSVSYRGTGSPLNRPSGASAHLVVGR